jgi:hypothetical protein
MGEVTEGHPAYRRQVRFDWSTTPLRWVPGDPFSTHMINVLHLLLPTGEWWFIEAVNEATPLVDDEELRQAIRRSSSRRPGTRRPITSCSSTWPIRESTTRNPTSNGSTTGSPRSQGRRTNGGRHRCAGCGPTDTWQTPAALEQFTAVLGQRVIQNRGLDYAGADPVMLDLLRWHGAEEVEHRSLVFDVYQNVCGSNILVAGRRAVLDEARSDRRTRSAVARLAAGGTAVPRARAAAAVCGHASAVPAAQPSSRLRGVDRDGDGLLGEITGGGAAQADGSD